MGIAVVAHRGHSRAARENTVEAFRRAVEADADWIELDVRTTRDGHSIVLHDATTLRLWGHPAEVSQMDLAEVQALGLADNRIPTLAEVLDAVALAKHELGREVGILVDCGAAGDARTAHAVIAADDRGLAVRWCGDTDAMLAIREADEQARLAYNHHGGPLPTELLARLRPETINVEWVLVGQELVDSVQRLGMALATWTVDDAETMSWLIELGVDSITTNRPDVLRSLVRRGTSPLALAWTDAAQLAARTGIDDDLARAITVARQLAEWTNAFTRASLPERVRTKEHAADLVTEVDEAVERHVRDVIAAALPGHLVVGEEMGGNSEPGRPTWYLDPVDGTTNLANRVPWTSMSLALAVDDRPLVAAVCQPWLNQVSVAAAGLGATLNGRPLEVARADTLAGRTFLTELDAHLPWAGMDDFVAALGANHATARVMGSGTLAMASVGLGWAAGSLVHRFNPIDHLAGALISREAGAVVLAEDGSQTLFPSTGGLLVAAPGVEDRLHEIWRSSRR